MASLIITGDLMEEMYLEWARQARNAFEKDHGLRFDRVFRSVVVAGMGGSGIVGDVLATLATLYSSTPVITIKNHVLPHFVSSDDLLLVVSYSGNTLETLRLFETGLRRKIPMTTVSSGGLLKEKSLEQGIPHVQLPKGLAPRASLPSMLYGILRILIDNGLFRTPPGMVENSIIFLEKTVGKALAEAGLIAEWIHNAGGLLVISTHTPLEALALRGKNEFNENAKIPVKIDVSPEWMHNDIVGYESPFLKDFSILEIVDPDDKVGVSLVNFMERIYSRITSKFYRLSLEGGNLLEKLMYGSLLLGLSSCKLARIRGLDPLRTLYIQEYKNEAESIFKD
ncbi:MAG: SIS domain-containing protein [Thermosphaera sp.]